MGLYKKGKNWFIDYCVHGRRKRGRVGPNNSESESGDYPSKTDDVDDKMDKKRI